MKKHIIIAGVPRAGKSTISQMISKKFGYQHIRMDSIIAGIERTFSETGINSDADAQPCDNVVNISAKMAPFIRVMMDSGEYDEFDYGMVSVVYHYAKQLLLLDIRKILCNWRKGNEQIKIGFTYTRI